MYRISYVEHVPAPFFPPRPRSRWRLVRAIILLGIWGGLLIGAALLWLVWDIPRPAEAAQAVRRPTLSLADGTGRVFARYGDIVGEKLHLGDLPPELPAAVVAVEDRRFWTHPGFDVIGIVRAALVNLEAGRTVQGGSTITQQVAKNLFLTRARTWRRKAQEMLLTLWLEAHFSKREILEIWLNRVYLGAGAWGVDAAAHVYFGVSARHLALWQCAVLAGLPRAPSRFSPRVDPDAATARTAQVLDAMVGTGAITDAQQADALEHIRFPSRRQPAGYFADWAAGEAEAVVPADADAVVRTTLDPRLQAAAERSLAALLDGVGRTARVGQGAVVALDADTGAVRAMVGGRDYAASAYNRAVLARRQPGSAFKPFVWLAALEAGLHPDDTVSDLPVIVDGWSPRNAEPGFHGEVSLADALAQSVNTVAVRLLERAGGAAAVANVARRLGIADKLPDNATLALGTGGVGVLELASAYTPFFAGGERVAPTAVAGVTVGGRALPFAHPAPVAVVDPARAAEMAAMLRGVVEHGTGRAAAVPGRDVAGKTGTTQDSRDAWFVGALGHTVIAVWLGNDDNRPMAAVMGGGLPARLFRDVARSLAG